nr:PREDICTED: uncharacterized protein LOC105664049 [Megachile rotundata]
MRCDNRESRGNESRDGSESVARIDSKTSVKQKEEETMSITRRVCASEEGQTEDALLTSTADVTMLELNLDLSGLDNDTSNNVSSDLSSDFSSVHGSYKCWKSPEEVRLGCGRVAALARYFSKLDEIESIIRDKSRSRSRDLQDYRRFVSEPDFTSIEMSELGEADEIDETGDIGKIDETDSEMRHRGRNRRRRSRLSRLVDKRCRSELDMRNDSNERRVKDICWSAGKLTLENSSTDTVDDNEREKESPTNDKKRKLSLAEQRRVIEQLEEMSNLEGTIGTPSIFQLAVLSECSESRLDPRWIVDLPTNTVRRIDDNLLDDRWKKQLAVSCPNLDSARSLVDPANRLDSGFLAKRDSRVHARISYQRPRDSYGRSEKAKSTTLYRATRSASLDFGAENQKREIRSREYELSRRSISNSNVDDKNHSYGQREEIRDNGSSNGDNDEHRLPSERTPPILYDDDSFIVHRYDENRQKSIDSIAHARTSIDAETFLRKQFEPTVICACLSMLDMIVVRISERTSRMITLFFRR